MIENGAHVNTQGGYYGNALQAASFCGYKGIAMFLIENGADVNAPGQHCGHEEIVKLLIENWAHMNAQGGSYRNVLYAASFCSHKAIAKLLVERCEHWNDGMKQY